MVEGKLKQFEASEDAKLLDANFDAAFRMMTSPQARAAFDLSKEPTTVRERYGMNRFGQCCLLARRLIEAGVRFVTVNTFLTVFNEISWDIHGSLPFISVEQMKKDVAPMYDQAYSALIEDLVQRGMLDNTLVCNLAEFGRTPRINPGRRPRPLAAMLDDLFRRRRRARGPGRRPQRSRSAAFRPSGPSNRRKSWPRFSTAWGWTRKRSCPARKAGPIRWSITASIRSRSCFDACTAEGR